jgi:murein L,D-transpeptidase YcbB/YkuD
VAAIDQPALALPPPPPPSPPQPPLIIAGAEALLRLADRLQRLEEDGLEPEAYGIPAAALATADPAGFRAGLQRAAGLVLADLLHGRGRDIAGRPDIRRDIAAIPLSPWLAELAAAVEPALVIDRAAAMTEDAAPLKRELARLRALARRGPWPAIPVGETIEPGSTDPLRVPALRARLAAEDPALAAARDFGPLYDPALEAAVRRFQAEQGLEVDGRVGRISQALLNRPIEARIDQLRVALDMRRGAMREGPERRLEVNIPDYRLRVLEQGREILSMAVVVGRADRATPLMRTRMTAAQFNPPWGVPERNAREDLLPRFRRDPQAMMEKGFRVYGVVGGERVEIDPRSIDWRSVNPERFPYVIRQDAGEMNALGRLKLVMPNGDDIFMHDTPDRHLFRRPDRAFSSGCIRLERPMELLDLLLEGTPGWTRDRAQAALDARVTSGVAVRRPIPVVLRYQTATVEAGGAVRVRPDVYGLDAAYARRMQAGALRVAAAATAVPAAAAGAR